MDENTDVIQAATETAADIAVGAVKETGNILHLDKLYSYLGKMDFSKIVTGLIAIIIFYIIYRIIKHIIIKNASKKLQQKTVAVITKAFSYCFYVVIAAYILELLGINLSVVWGAAGIAGVAVGFAAQTTVSNLISGIFVLTDKAMKIGDYIELDGTGGTVDSVGPLSIKIHTADNQLIRIPNSSVMGAKLMNYSSFEYRRYVFSFSVDYSSDLDKTLSAMKRVPALCPTVINNIAEYSPSVFYASLGESGINMNITVWCERANFLQTKNDICLTVVKICREEGINIPYNQLDVRILEK